MNLFLKLVARRDSKSEKHPSGAKARSAFWSLSARLKSCPFKTPLVRPVDCLGRSAAIAAVVCLVLAGSAGLVAQQPDAAEPAHSTALAQGKSAPVVEQEPRRVALPLAEDRGCAGLEQALKRLGTTASVLMIVAHPDD